MDSTTNVGARNAYDASVGVRYLLFDRGRSARASGAEAQLLAANFRHNATLQDVALNVAESYYSLAAAGSLQALSRETVAQRENHLALADARYKSGQTAKSDVLKAQTEKADAEFGAVKADAAVHIARSQLAAAMGLRVSERLEIVPPPETVPQEDLVVTEAILDQLASTRPELRAALAQVQAQRAQVKTAEAGYWPTVSASADAGVASRDFPPDQDEWSLGVGISLPLFTGFDRRYQVRQAKADLDKAIADAENQLRGVELEVWTAYARVIEARQGMAAAARLVESAEESARVAEGEYKSGAGSIIGLIDAQTSRSSARARLVQTRLDWYTARARLDRAIGRAVAEPSSTSIHNGEAP
jgi:outer membrane protein TolC